MIHSSLTRAAINRQFSFRVGLPPDRVKVAEVATSPDGLSNECEYCAASGGSPTLNMHCQLFICKTSENSGLVIRGRINRLLYV
jgi:hypothetical protein